MGEGEATDGGGGGGGGEVTETTVEAVSVWTTVVVLPMAKAL